MSATSDAAAAAIVAALPAYPFTVLGVWQAIEAAEEPYWGSGAAVPTDDYDFSAAAGVTLNNGTVGGTASITGGVCREVIPAATTAHWDGVNGYQAASAYVVPGGSPYNFLCAVRVASAPSEPSSDAMILLREVATGLEYCSLWRPANGDFRARRQDTDANLATVNPSGLASGTAWIGFRRTGEVLEFLYGSGVGTDPPEKFTTGHAIAGVGATAFDRIYIVWRHFGGGAAGAITCDFDDLVIRYLGDTQ